MSKITGVFGMSHKQDCTAIFFFAYCFFFAFGYVWEQIKCKLLLPQKQGRAKVPLSCFFLLLTFNFSLKVVADQPILQFIWCVHHARRSHKCQISCLPLLNVDSLTRMSISFFLFKSVRGGWQWRILWSGVDSRVNITHKGWRAENQENYLLFFCPYF